MLLGSVDVVQLQQWSEQHFWCGTLVSQITALTPVLSLLPLAFLRLQGVLGNGGASDPHTWNHVARIGRRPEATGMQWPTHLGGQVRLPCKTLVPSVLGRRSVLSTGGASGIGYGTVPSGSAGVCISGHEGTVMLWGQRLNSQLLYFNSCCRGVLTRHKRP
jgi:hypothetical protein